MKALKEAIELLKFFKDRKNTKITTMIKVQSCIAELEALQQRSCKTCKYYNTERPRSHPNYAECNKRDCPLSYVEVHYAFCCSEHTPKEQ